MFVLKTADDVAKCVVNCPQGYLGVDGKCVKDTQSFDCASQTVEMVDTGTCTRCTSDYDGGKYWDRASSKCTK